MRDSLGMLDKLSSFTTDNITLDDFLQLTEGDIIKLDNKVQDDLIVKVNGEKKFFARPGTIKDNILMGKPGATDEEIREAAEIAELSEFIDSLDDGFDHELNQSGKNLSGGQRQRLSIARAVVKNSPIYIFDDSFSALDFLTESRLRTKLSKKAAGKTQIVITQRVTSAMNSDLILVMDNGFLVDSGKHSELLERCGIYREIYASQTGGAVK